MNLLPALKYCRIRFNQIIRGGEDFVCDQVARHFSAVLDAVEREQQEIVLVRNQRYVARLVPEAPPQDALRVFGDLYRTIDEPTAEALAAATASSRKSRRGRVAELRNPWVG